MTKEERQEGYSNNCVVHYEKVPDYLNNPSWYVHEGWMQGSEWASQEQKRLDIEKSWKFFEPYLIAIKVCKESRDAVKELFIKAIEEYT